MAPKINIAIFGAKIQIFEISDTNMILTSVLARKFKCNIFDNYLFFLSLQIEISHKNQVPMLVGPPPKSRSFFSFLTKDFRAKGEDNFEDDPE